MPKKPKSLLGRFLVWRVKNISHRQFIYLLSILIGFASGMGAVILKNATHFIQSFVHGQESHHYAYFVFPILGILITVLIAKYIIREAVGHGIPSTLYAISRRKGIMRRYQMYASIFTAPFTVGFGGSVGLEGPTVATGAALGSNIARVFHTNQKTRIITNWLCCGRCHVCYIQSTHCLHYLCHRGVWSGFNFCLFSPFIGIICICFYHFIFFHGQRNSTTLFPKRCV